MSPLIRSSHHTLSNIIFFGAKNDPLLISRVPDSERNALNHTMDIMMDMHQYFFINFLIFRALESGFQNFEMEAPQPGRRSLASSAAKALAALLIFILPASTAGTGVLMKHRGAEVEIETDFDSLSQKYLRASSVEAYKKFGSSDMNSDSFSDLVTSLLEVTSEVRMNSSSSGRLRGGFGSEVSSFLEAGAELTCQHRPAL